MLPAFGLGLADRDDDAREIRDARRVIRPLLEKPVDSQGRPSAVRAFFIETLGIRRLLHAWTALFLLIFLAIPVVHVMKPASLWLLVWGFAVVVVVPRIPMSRRTSWITIGACFAIYLTAQLLMLANHWVEPVSDFRTMWETAKDYVEHGLRVPDRPQTQRAIPFYYPLIQIFGASPKVYLTSNVVLHSATFLMSVWVARRFFGWQAAAKTALLLLLGFEPLFANLFPSHDVFGSFSVLLFLVILAELEHRIEGESRWQKWIIGGSVLLMASTITWSDWQRGMGVFCSLALVFYGMAAFGRRAARWRLRLGIVVAVIALSAIQSCGLKSCGLAAKQAPHELTSNEMTLLVFGSDEGDGRFADWYRNARMATALGPEAVASLSKLAPIESLRDNPRRKYRNYLERQINFLRSGNDAGWYLTIESPRWLDAKQITFLYERCQKYAPPIWWALALLIAISTMLRRDVVFDYRTTPLFLVCSFMAAMGLLGETQSRYAMFFVFVWPIYAGAPWLARPLPDAALGPPKRALQRLGGIAVTVAVAMAIPIIALGLSTRVMRPRLADLHHSTVRVGKTHTSIGSAGAPPWWKLIRNHAVISDAGLGSHDVTLSLTTEVPSPTDDSTLRFVVYNELGEPLEPPDKPTRLETVEGRALRVFVDGTLRQTIDLSNAMAPRAFAIPGFAAGEHAIRFELDFGGDHRSTVKEKCGHRWTAPPSCFNTSIAYVGFY
jgi:hypothetical protein